MLSNPMTDCCREERMWFLNQVLFNKCDDCSFRIVSRVDQTMIIMVEFLATVDSGLREYMCICWLVSHHKESLKAASKTGRFVVEAS